ncbi:uncharacterized protein JCM15063_003777 [Sporobolomyces koalae]|uniref:uncharacterized protein n=1 Tax=Sporobolomyces koalae TaxID=500713 RepID=UPI00316CE17F
MNQSVESTPRAASASTADLASTASANPEERDLWSTILDSVKGSRGSVSTKRCVVLGTPGSGKSTLVERLQGVNGEPATTGRRETLDLGMSYSVIELKDEGSRGDEETLASLSVYQLPSPLAPFPDLLPLALSTESLVDSVVVIVLDWDKPWQFMRQLEQWIAMIETKLNLRQETAELIEAKERLENQVRNYQEPTASASAPAQAAASTPTVASTIDLDSPLPPGTLVDNLGLGLIVVCTKADRINVLEREREFTEEQFDYIQQTLRTVCLRYGAALFFTSQTIPQSFSRLRQYILHRLFTTPTSTTSTESGSAPGSKVNSKSNASPATIGGRTLQFPFPHRANVIDRDQLLVPTGWDSWGKIKVMRERFDCEAVGNKWAIDTSSKSSEGEPAEEGLTLEYEMVVVDFDDHDQPNNSNRPLVKPLPEQSFLRTHYDTIQQDVEKDPRLAFKHTASAHSSSSTHAIGATNLSRVGPMSGQIGDLPNVQHVLDRASQQQGGSSRDRERGHVSSASTGGVTAARTTSAMSRQGSNSGSNPLTPSMSAAAAAGTSHNSRTTPSAAGSTAAGVAGGGNQVLADFFQSLLTARSTSSSSSSSAATATNTAPPSLPPTSATSTNDPPVNAVPKEPSA